jgi:hypothetical protein
MKDSLVVHHIQNLNLYGTHPCGIALTRIVEASAKFRLRAPAEVFALLCSDQREPPCRAIVFQIDQLIVHGDSRQVLAMYGSKRARYHTTSQSSKVCRLEAYR